MVDGRESKRRRHCLPSNIDLSLIRTGPQFRILHSNHNFNYNETLFQFWRNGTRRRTHFNTGPSKPTFVLLSLPLFISACLDCIFSWNVDLLFLVLGPVLKWPLHSSSSPTQHWEKWDRLRKKGDVIELERDDRRGLKEREPIERRFVEIQKKEEETRSKRRKVWKWKQKKGKEKSDQVQFSDLQ